jgi:hypothetical protein
MMVRLISVGSVCALVGGIGALDDQVGRVVLAILRGESPSELSWLVARLLRVPREIAEAVGIYAGDHLALVGYALGALVLLALMLRT